VYKRVSHAFDKEQVPGSDFQPSPFFIEGCDVLISSDLEDEPNAGV